MNVLDLLLFCNVHRSRVWDNIRGFLSYFCYQRTECESA